MYEYQFITFHPFTFLPLILNFLFFATSFCHIKKKRERKVRENFRHHHNHDNNLFTQRKRTVCMGLYDDQKNVYFVASSCV